MSEFNLARELHRCAEGAEYLEYPEGTALTRSCFNAFLRAAIEDQDYLETINHAGGSRRAGVPMRVRLACLQDNLTRVCIPACRGKLTACDIIDQTHIREYIVFVAIKPLPRGANGTGGWREACYASVMTTQRAKRAISMSIAAIAPTARIDVPRAPTALKRARPCLQGRASSDIAKKHT